MVACLVPYVLLHKCGSYYIISVVALTVVRFGCCSLVGGHKFDEFFLRPTYTQTAIYHNVNEKQLC